jgi:hypothetical protein
MTKTKDVERPAYLMLFPRDGLAIPVDARVKADTKVSVGRTDSKRALGFEIVSRKGVEMDFVLDRDQVTELHAFLQLALPGLLKPRGRAKGPLMLSTMMKRWGRK